MKVTVEAFGRRLKVHATKTRPRPPESAPPWEPAPQGCTCGDLERAPSWDHDNRQPLGFTRSRP